MKERRQWAARQVTERFPQLAREARQYRYAATFLAVIVPITFIFGTLAVIFGGLAEAAIWPMTPLPLLVFWGPFHPGYQRRRAAACVTRSLTRQAAGWEDDERAGGLRYLTSVDAAELRESTRRRLAELGRHAGPLYVPL